MFPFTLSPSASIQAKGFEEVARKNSSHTLKEEEQEESQHPDTVQPVGPHASPLSLAPLPLPFSPSLPSSLSFFFFLFFFFLLFPSQIKRDVCFPSVPLGSALPALAIQSQAGLTRGGQIPKQPRTLPSKCGRKGGQVRCSP